MDLTLKSLCGAAALFAGLSASTAFADDANPVRNRTISYATVTMHWSVYQTADAKAECPNGLNDYGPREVFKSYFGDGKGKSVVESQLSLSRSTHYDRLQNRQDHRAYTVRSINSPVLDLKFGTSSMGKSILTSQINSSTKLLAGKIGGTHDGRSRDTRSHRVGPP